MSLQVHCPQCGAAARLYLKGTTDPTTFFTASPHYQIADSGPGSARLDVYRCTACGHGFTPYTISPAILERWYQQSPADHVFLDDMAARRKTARLVLARIRHLNPPGVRLLDIGAGPGLFLAEAKELNWNVSGLEPSAWGVNYAQQHLGLSTVQAGTVERVREWPDRSFDVITAFDVIEHLITPDALIAHAARLLTPQGLLVLTTPRFDSWLCRLLRARCYFIFPAHLHLFSRRSLTTLLTKHGFEIARERTHTRYLSAGYLWYRLRAYLGYPKSLSVSKQQLILPINFGDEFEIYARKRSDA